MNNNLLNSNYPQNGSYPQDSVYPQGNYPQDSCYPQEDNYSQNNNYPQDNNYPQGDNNYSQDNSPNNISDSNKFRIEELLLSEPQINHTHNSNNHNQNDSIDTNVANNINNAIALPNSSTNTTCLIQNLLQSPNEVVTTANTNDVNNNHNHNNEFVLQSNGGSGSGGNLFLQDSLQQGSKFSSHTDFVVAVQEYAIRQGFTMRLHKLKRNREGIVRWREIVCSRSGSSCKKKVGERPTRNRLSQRCQCPFLIRASANGVSGLWEIISTNFNHNHELGSNN